MSLLAKLGLPQGRGLPNVFCIESDLGASAARIGVRYLLVLLSRSSFIHLSFLQPAQSGTVLGGGWAARG